MSPRDREPTVENSGGERDTIRYTLQKKGRQWGTGDKGQHSTDERWDSGNRQKEQATQEAVSAALGKYSVIARGMER